MSTTLLNQGPGPGLGFEDTSGTIAAVAAATASSIMK
jgi:hypothetical protein